MSRIPDCGVKLEGEDDVVVVADLADEAALGAQVAVVDMLGGESDEGVEEACVHPVCDLWRASEGRQAFQAAMLSEAEAVWKTWSAAPPDTLPEGLLPPKKSLPAWARKAPWIRPNEAVQLPDAEVTRDDRVGRRDPNPQCPPSRKGMSPALTHGTCPPAGNEPRSR